MATDSGRIPRWLVSAVVAACILGTAAAASSIFRVDHIADRDTITLTNGKRGCPREV
jgi:hypothetical protein